MLAELIIDIVKLALIVASFYLMLVVYVRCQQPTWAKPMVKSRLIIIAILILAASTAKLSEDVLGKESGVVDTAILLYIHHHMPSALIGFFEIVSFTGSYKVMLPLTLLATTVLLWGRYRLDALLVAASVISATVMVYVTKLLVGRERPVLWDVDQYWGSSFPSGHTLVVAAFAISLALCIGRIKPAAHSFALSIAVLWIILVAISRMVLGVHWPTDVLVAACLGGFLPLVISVAIDLRQIHPSRRNGG